jgi:hypothetical protein
MLPPVLVVEGAQADGFAVAAAQSKVTATDSSREQCHAFASGCRPAQGSHCEVHEVAGAEPARADVAAVERGVGGVVGRFAVVVDEGDEAGVLHSVTFGRGGGPQYPLVEGDLGGEGHGVAGGGHTP